MTEHYSLVIILIKALNGQSCINCVLSCGGSVNFIICWEKRLLQAHKEQHEEHFFRVIAILSACHFFI
jgi:hypothetical protein